jgi:hypothetical protein
MHKLLPLVLILLTPVIYAAPLCPSVSSIRQAQLTLNNHDQYNTWNFAAQTGDWTVIVGNVKANNQQDATNSAQLALSGMTGGANIGKFQQRFVCTYQPYTYPPNPNNQFNNNYYVIAWNNRELPQATMYRRTQPATPSHPVSQLSIYSQD